MSFYYATDFSEGRAFVVIQDGEERKYGFIDNTGSMVIKTEEGYFESFSEGLTAVKKDGLYGFIDKDGKTVIDNNFVKTGKFSDGMCRVYDQVNRVGFINQDGELVIDYKGDYEKKTTYEPVGDFYDGLAVVEGYGKERWIKLWIY